MQSQLVIGFLRSIRDIEENDVNDYYRKFMENGITDMKVIRTLKDRDLKEIGITNVFHRRRILMECKVEMEHEKVTLGSDYPEMANDEKKEMKKENGVTLGWDFDAGDAEGDEGDEGDDGVMEDAEQPGKE